MSQPVISIQRRSKSSRFAKNPMAAVLIFVIDFIDVIYSNDPERTTSANRRRLYNRIPGEFFPVEHIGAKKKKENTAHFVSIRH